MIPRIIHQSWKTGRIPEKWQAFQASWKSLNPTYEYRYWTDDDNRTFILRHYPDYLGIYDTYSLDIQRAELARYLVLRHFGGVYADMDFEALRPIDGLVARAELLFGLEPPSHATRQPVRERNLDQIICNAFMASTAGHPFWDHFLDSLRAATGEANVLDATGPFLLTRACASYPSADRITLVPAPLLYPLDNVETRKLDAAAMRAKAGDAYAIHHWSGSWWPQSILQRARDRIMRARQPGEDR